MKPSRTWRAPAALAALLACGGTWAAAVDPVTHPGNFTSCSQLDDSLVGGSSGSAPADGQTYTFGGGQSITFGYTPSGQDKYIGFSATVPMDYIVIKGGDGYNVFHYDPASMSDIELFAPLNSSGEPAGVSHVSFCTSPKPTADKTAQASWKRLTDWTLEKSVTPDTITMFDGDSHDVDYTVTVSPITRGSYKVTGVITVKDPFEFGWDATHVVDTMKFNNNAQPFSVQWSGQAGDTLECAKPAANTEHIILTCAYVFELSSEDHPFLLQASGGVNGAGITVAKGGLTHTLSANASFSIPADPAASFGDTLAVDDSVLPEDPDHVFQLGGDTVWSYSRTFACDADEGQHHNVATGVWGTEEGEGSVSDDAGVNVSCETVTVTKDATTRYERSYAWTAEKWLVVSDADARVTGRDDCLADPIASGPYADAFLCNDADIQLNPGDVYDTAYQLGGNRTVEDEFGFAVSGNIEVSWPTGMQPEFDPTTPLDLMTFTDVTGGIKAVTPSCGAQGDGSLLCTYETSLPRPFVPGHNVAFIKRVTKHHDAQGNASDSGTVRYWSDQVELSYGDPSAEHGKCVVADDLFNSVAGLNLGSGFGWSLGEQCESFSDYHTGTISEDGVEVGSLDLHAAWIPVEHTGAGNSCEFMVPNVLTVGSGSDEAIATVHVPQLCAEAGCTYTQGYWKTHANYDQKPQFASKRDDAWDLIGGEDAAFHFSGMSYIEVMWNPPKGNTYFILAHQYIAAKLNVADGSGDAAIAAELAEAEGWFSAHAPSDAFWKQNQDVIDLAGTLAAYNEGDIGPGHCSVSPATDLRVQ